ncbi:uncharacterized protein [Excalfactoria chinensis]|uniref:uncharacterized protein n=1 Tax=Excalfactoria chinensis TaxID=46218 RepID=UPI003B3A031A
MKKMSHCLKVMSGFPHWAVLVPMLFSVFVSGMKSTHSRTADGTLLFSVDKRKSDRSRPEKNGAGYRRPEEPIPLESLQLQRRHIACWFASTKRLEKNPVVTALGLSFRICSPAVAGSFASRIGPDRLEPLEANSFRSVISFSTRRRGWTGTLSWRAYRFLQEYVPGTRRRSRCCGESSSRDAEARGAPRSGAPAAGPRGFHCPGSSVAGRDREAWKWACTHPKGASQLQSFVPAVTGDREEREASGARLQLRGLEDCRVKTIGAAFGKREKDGRQNYRFSLSRQVVESCGPGILKLGPQHSQWNNHDKATEAREMNSRIFLSHRQGR